MTTMTRKGGACPRCLRGRLFEEPLLGGSSLLVCLQCGHEVPASLPTGVTLARAAAGEPQRERKP